MAKLKLTNKEKLSRHLNTYIENRRVKGFVCTPDIIAEGIDDFEYGGYDECDYTVNINLVKWIK